MTWDYAAEVIADNPLLYWKFNELAGPDVIDYSGNGHDGLYFGSDLVFGVPGINSDETDTGVQINSNAGDDAGAILNPVPAGWPTTDLTIEYIFRNMAAPTPDQTLRTLMSYATGSQLDEVRQSNVGSTAPAWRMFGGLVNITTVGSVFTGGYNTHQVITWRNSDGRVQVWMNGALVGSNTIGATQSIGAGGSFVIGQNQSSVGGGFQYPPRFRICAFAVYPFVLSNNRIRTHASAALTSYYKAYSWPAPFLLQDGNPESEIVSFATAKPIVVPDNYFQRVWDNTNLVWCYYTGVLNPSPGPAETTPHNSGNIGDHQIVAILPGS